MEDFSTKVRQNLDLLDWTTRRDVIRLMVRRIEIDDGQIEMVFCIPPLLRRTRQRSHVSTHATFVQWSVERTLAWVSRNRRLARDHERHARKAAAFVSLAMIRLMLRRLAASS